MSRAYVFLADGFEEIEGLTVVDLLRRAKIDTTMVSIMETKKVIGSHGIEVSADGVFAEYDYADAEVLVLPGGMPGTKNLGAHEALCTLLKKHQEAGKLLAAICAAPSVFGALGFLNGKEATCYPGFEDALAGAKVSTAQVVTDGNIVTAKGMGAAIEFGLELIRQLTDGETADQIRDGIMYVG